ncbi:MAG TPA: phospholipid carrier-dependent glycosyltransferase [Thermoanaerobaculia bacterium]|nr:phospholipid carrier-dependent glycosyltransferase [Thermoanaerobaculia bacterium]
MRSGARASALGIILVVVVTLSLASVRLDSATADEPAYIATGMIKLVDGRVDYYRDEPPLMNSLSAAPLAIAGYRLPHFWTYESNKWGVGKQWLWRSGLDGHRMLFLARLPTVALFAALVATMFWFVRRETQSDFAALAAAILTGFCPNLMAHGRLATIDLALSFFTFAAAASFIVTIETGSRAAAIAMGVASAAAILSKTSGNILGPYFVIVLVIALVKRPADRRRLIVNFGIAVLAAIAFAEIFILAEARTLNPIVPLREYVENIRAIHAWYMQGHDHPQFLLGRFSTTGFREYYPVAFLLKTTIPAIALFALAIVRGRGFAAYALLLFAVLFMAVAMGGHLDLGIRYVLPIYPFVYAAIGIAVAQRTRAITIVAALLIVWHVAENVANYPQYISYFNEFIGSKRNADQYLVDSNLDWGQDLRRLGAWCREHGVRQITVHYFGGADLAYDLRGLRVVGWSSPAPQRLPKGYFALSRHMYRTSFTPGLFPMDYDTFLRMNRARYVTTVGGSIYVYAVD